MLALFDRVEFLVRLQRIQQVTAVFALQEGKAPGRKLRVHRQRHRVAQAARIDFAGRVGIAGLQRGKDPARRRGEYPDRGERRGAFPRDAGFRDRLEAAVGGRADIDEDAPGPVEHEWLERMNALLDHASVRKRDFPAGQFLDDRLDGALRIGRQRIEPEDRLRGGGVDLAVGPGLQPKRKVQPADQDGNSFALRGVGVEQQQPSLARIPAAHVRDHELAVSRNLHDRSRKDQAVFLAGDEAGAIAVAHADAKFRIGVRRLSAALVGQRVSAFEHGFGDRRRPSGGAQHDPAMIRTPERDFSATKAQNPRSTICHNATLGDV